jgi:PilZ domain
MSAALQLNENRIARRNRVFKAAKIVHLNQRSVVDCLIRDMSETGAKIVCGDLAAVPGEFEFLIPSDNTIRTAVAVWRRGQFVGVHFTSAPKPAPPQRY